MKQIIFILFSLSVICGTLACLKEEMPTQIVQATSHKYYTIEDTPGLRDGGQNPFHFMTDQVTYDPFKPGYPQEAANLQRLDSVKYQRIATPNAGAFGTSFDVYNITQYFKDGSTKVLNRVYAESDIGESYTHYPDVTYNQLAVNNPVNTVMLKRGTKSETYIDNTCGKVKRRFKYTHYFNSDSIGVNTIDGDRCASNVYSYQLITI
jgi:hypothetical protein